MKSFNPYIFLLFIFCFGFGLSTQAQSLNKNYLNYIESWHQTAVKQQKKYGIPASITLAQGLLESGAGQSYMSRESNNHFGIKCHDWQGDKVFHDDDEEKECFRKYDNASESYEDHSLFLKNRPRYAGLFNLKQTDYVNWAHGLKKAGYATDPAYAYKLIALIETYNLHQYDKMHTGIFHQETENNAQQKEVAAGLQHEIYKSNCQKFVVSGTQDTYKSIADEFEMSESKLREFNDVGPNAVLQSGSIVFLKKKKSKAFRGYTAHVVREGETMYSISQNYGIRLISLYKMNKMPFTSGAQVGQIIKLR